MRIGEYQDLEVTRDTQQGLYLTDGQSEVLLPNRQCPPDLRIGDTIRVFVLTDSEDRPIATTKRPYATIGKFAKLRVVEVSEAGAFLDWGLDKDLFCPFREQLKPMREGDEYVVRIYLDETSQRIACTSRLNKYLQLDGEGLQPGQAVQIMIVDFVKDAATVIVDDRIKASLFRDEWHERLNIGEVRQGYVKSIRPEDKKVAVSLRPVGYQAVLGERDKLLKSLQLNGGTLNVSDKSSPEEIHRRVGLSKAAFKKLLGALFKEGLIEIEPYSIRLKK